MRYIDAHIHVNIGGTVNRFPDFDFSKYIIDQQRNKAYKNYLFLNPTFLNLLCPLEKTHRIAVRDTNEANTLEFYCTICKKVIYRGSDPYHKANIALLRLSHARREVVPFIFLAMSNNTIPYELKFFENSFANSYCGYKIHPSLNRRNPAELTKLKSKRPIIVHSSTGNFASPKNIAQFALNYEGNVSIAHLASFDSSFLNDEIPANLFFDCSPLSVLANEYRNHDENVFFNQADIDDKEQDDLMLRFLNKSNMMFATDAPWSNREKELQFINKLKPRLLNPDDFFVGNALKFAGEYMIK